MKNFIRLYALVLFLLLACKKNDKTVLKTKNENAELTKINNDSLKKVKDTTLFVNSSEGEEVNLFINVKTQDSIIESEILGETGKSTYKFIFNKTLKSGECTIYRYSEPIYANSNPKIKIEKKENLSSSKESSNRLTNIFNSYLKVFLYQKDTYKSANTK